MKESNILKIIQIEAGKRGYLALRLNSGKAWQGKLKNTKEYGMILTDLRAIELCPQGTSDLLLVEKNGVSVWCETKTATGQQRQSQLQFQKAVESLGHTYILARTKEDVFK